MRSSNINKIDNKLSFIYEIKDFIMNTSTQRVSVLPGPAPEPASEELIARRKVWKREELEKQRKSWERDQEWKKLFKIVEEEFCWFNKEIKEWDSFIGSIVVSYVTPYDRTFIYTPCKCKRKHIQLKLTSREEVKNIRVLVKEKKSEISNDLLSR